MRNLKCVNVCRQMIQGNEFPFHLQSVEYFCHEVLSYNTHPSAEREVRLNSLGTGTESPYLFL